MRLSAAMAARDDAEVLQSLRDCAAEVDPVAVEETILQAYLFLGYPAALNTFAEWREISGRPADPATGWDPAGWRERGEDVCRVVYGGQYDGLRENVRSLHPDMEEWMVREGYGKVLARPGLELRVRELCIVAILAVQGAPRQLYSHLRGALHAGARTEEIEGALEVATRFRDEEGARESQQVWERVLRRRQGS